MSEAEIHLGSRTDASGFRPAPMREAPFCIAVLGDFGGHELGESAGLEIEGVKPSWRPIRATPDTVTKLAGLKPRIPAGPGAHIELDSIEGFDPDHLFATAEAFAKLREARTALEEGRDPETDPGLEALPASSIEPGTAVPASTPPTDAGHTMESMDAPPPGGLLDAILERAEPGPTTAGPGDDLQEFIRAAVRKHTVRDGPDRSDDISRVDGAASELMRSILHAPATQALEALWKGLVFLLSNSDTTGKVRVYLVDVPRAELERDLLDTEDLSRTKLAQLLLSHGSEAIAHPWALAVGAYAFDESDSDIELLASIAAISGTAKMAWLSEGSSRLAGCASLSENPHPDDWDEQPASWSLLRSIAGADHLALATPRFVAREPYGSLGRKARRFAFEEQTSQGGVSEGLWANPAFACAVLLAREAVEGSRATGTADVDLVPVPAMTLHGEGEAPRLTRARLTPDGATQLLKKGLTPLIEFPPEARIRVAGIRSAASPGSRLQAWWRHS